VTIAVRSMAQTLLPPSAAVRPAVYLRGTVKPREFADGLV
jgi:hypothetical protein